MPCGLLGPLIEFALSRSLSLLARATAGAPSALRLCPSFPIFETAADFVDSGSFADAMPGSFNVNSLSVASSNVAGSTSANGPFPKYAP